LQFHKALRKRVLTIATLAECLVAQQPLSLEQKVMPAPPSDCSCGLSGQSARDQYRHWPWESDCKRFPAILQGHNPLRLLDAAIDPASSVSANAAASAPALAGTLRNRYVPLPFSAASRCCATAKLLATQTLRGRVCYGYSGCRTRKTRRQLSGWPAQHPPMAQRW
jgi:hypothetical protein